MRAAVATIVVANSNAQQRAREITTTHMFFLRIYRKTMPLPPPLHAENMISHSNLTQHLVVLKLARHTQPCRPALTSITIRGS
jgi:hypothetical protein